jgi:hypothetical protein
MKKTHLTRKVLSGVSAGAHSIKTAYLFTFSRSATRLSVDYSFGTPVRPLCVLNTCEVFDFFPHLHTQTTISERVH